MTDDRLKQQRSRFVDDLLSYMTLEEKLGQLDLAHSPNDPAVEKAIAAGRIGGVAGADAPNRLQALATERSRLGIPLLLTGSTPDLELSPWALGASWDEDLLRAVGASAARGAIGGGFNCLPAPRVALAGAPESSNTHIAVCEPHLGARLAAAFAWGADGETEDRRSAVLAIPALASKPDVGGFGWAIGIAQAEDVGGIDCTVLGPDLAQRIGFDGLLMDDCRRISAAVTDHYRLTSVRSPLEAAERALADGLLGEQQIDQAVRGVLAAKHRLGLFRDSQRIVTPPVTGPGYARQDQRVRATFVLLRNEAGLLPLSPVSDRVLVVGAPDGAGAACADALGRGGIGHSVAPGLAQRRADETWALPVTGDHFALSLTCDAARRADFVLVVLDERHFASPSRYEGWRQPTAACLAMLRGLALSGARLVAIIATAEPVDLAAADQHFAAVLQCWQPIDGFEEALCDVLSGRFSPQGRMPVSAGRYVAGHGLGFGENVIGSLTLTPGSHHVSAAVRVRNSGSFASRETVQAYTRDEAGRLRLIAFEHALLAPGEDVQIAFELGLEALGTPGSGGRIELAPGRYEIMIGKSSSRLLAASIDISPALARAIISRDRGYLRLAAG